MNEMPMSLKLTLAMLGNDRDAADRIIAEGIGTMTKKYLDIAHEYTVEDLPFVVASMQIAARSLAMILPESGQSLANNIVNRTESVVVDLTEMKKQMRKEDGSDGKMDQK